MLSFSKYEGAGNDFILIEDFSGSFPFERVQSLCDRKRGIGADGLILLQRSKKADFRMRIFNADGSEAAMCGNGLRCFGQFLLDLGFKDSSYRIETNSGVLTAWSEKGKMFTQLGCPREIFWNRGFAWKGDALRGYAVDTGVPHLIFFQEVQEFPLFARQLRAQENMNVSIASVLDTCALLLCTYERGVEAVTLACGTAAVASAFIATKLFGWEGRKISVTTASGDLLEVEGTVVTGPVVKVFHGALSLFL